MSENSQIATDLIAAIGGEDNIIFLQHTVPPDYE